MKLSIVFVLILTGCADHYKVKPFECRCSCEENSFECKGEASDMQENKISRYVKDKL